MQVREVGDRVPRRYYLARPRPDGPSKNRRSCRLASADEPEGRAAVPRLHELLPAIYRRFFGHGPAALRPHEEGRPVGVGRRRGIRVPNAEGLGNVRACINPPGLTTWRQTARTLRPARCSRSWAPTKNGTRWPSFLRA